MPSRYRLDFLLQLRRLEREAREVELAAVVRRVAAAREQAERARQRLIELGVETGRPPAEALARDWQYFGDTVTRTLDFLRASVAAEATLAAELAEAQASYAAARAKEKALDKHRERVLQAERQDADRRHQNEADDRAAMRTGRPQGAEKLI